MTNRSQYNDKEVVISDVSNTKYLVFNKLTGESLAHGTYEELAQVYGNQLVDDAINGEDSMFGAEEATYMWNSNIGYTKNKFFQIK